MSKFCERKGDVCTLILEAIPGWIIKHQVKDWNKEKGHRAADPFEDDVCRLLGDRLGGKRAKKARSVEDLTLFEALANVKIGFVRTGQPNSGSLRRWFTLVEKGVRELWFIVINISDDLTQHEVVCFNVLANLELFHYDDGTQQLMLRQEDFYININKLHDEAPSKAEMMRTLLQMKRDGFARLQTIRIQEMEKMDHRIARAL